MKLYQIYDKVESKWQDAIMFAQTGASCIRANLNWIVGRGALKDFELWEIGWQDENGRVHIEESCDNYIEIKWNEYRFPEDKAEALAPLQAQKMIDKIDKQS